MVLQIHTHPNADYKKAVADSWQTAKEHVLSAKEQMLAHAHSMHAEVRGVQTYLCCGLCAATLLLKSAICSALLDTTDLVCICAFPFTPRLTSTTTPESTRSTQTRRKSTRKKRCVNAWI